MRNATALPSTSGCQSYVGVAAQMLPPAKSLRGRAAGSDVYDAAASHAVSGVVGVVGASFPPVWKYERRRDGLRRRPGRVARLGDGVRGAHRLAGGRTGLPEDPHRRLGLVGGAGGRVVGVAGEAVGREGDAVDAEDRLVDRRRRGARRHGHLRDRALHVEVEELGEVQEHLRVERRDVRAVRRRDLQGAGRDRREVREHVGPAATGLLVLPRTRDERGDLDLVGEGPRRLDVAALRVHGIADGRVVVLRVDDVEHVAVLLAELHVERAGGVTVLDPVDDPVGALRVGPLVLVHALGDPLHREAVVLDPTGGEDRTDEVVGRRQRGHRGEVRRLRRAHEHLHDPRVRDADRRDPSRPRLRGDRLDGVVPVEALQGLEQVERTARAARPAHVDADVGVPARAGR